MSTPPPKRRKLPTIKKVKQTNTNTASTKPADPILPLPDPPKTAGRAIAATLGRNDFDLRNADVYNELFKTAGCANAPASGLARREKEEERRRELRKMRDVAKAKRSQEADIAFDLTSQTEKIVCYEDKLKALRSNALYPNCFAAKWRERWEQEKDTEQGKVKKQNRGQLKESWPNSGDVEEGEADENML